MQPAVLRAFRDELVKIAGGEDLSQVQKKLEPGDILLGGVRKATGWGAITNYLNTTFQYGTKYPHAALYIGGGRVIDTHPSTGVVEKSLQDFADRYKFRALRVSTTPEVRSEAVGYARGRIGTPYSTLQSIRAGLTSPEAPPKRERQEKMESAICSTLVSNAYHTVPLGKKRPIDLVRPVDLQRSPLTKTVLEYK